MPTHVCWRRISARRRRDVPSATPILDVRGLSAARSAAVVVRGIDLTIAKGEAVALLGTNGAGKSTMVDAICGLARKHGGQVQFFGEDITGAPPHRIARLGLLQVSQERDLFPRMTVGENVAMGWEALAARGDANHGTDDVTVLFPRLRERWEQRASSLSGGERTMLAIARALVGRPRLLLLDEPSSGLAPIMVEQVADALRTLARTGLTILLVEQNIGLALGVCDRFVVLREGRKVYDEPRSALGDDPRAALAALYL